MIFLLQGVEVVEAVVDSLQLSRVEVHPFQSVADFLADVLQFNETFVGARGQFLSSGKDVLDAVQLIDNRAQTVDDAR